MSNKSLCDKLLSNKLLGIKSLCAKLASNKSLRV